MKKKSKILRVLMLILITFVSIILLFVGGLYLLTLYYHHQNQKEYREEFNVARESFETVNAIMLDRYDEFESDESEQRFIYFTEREFRERSTILRMELYLKDGVEEDILLNVTEELNEIDTVLNYDFEYVRAYDNYIVYGGDGYNAYIYSIDGKKPDFFVFPDSTVPFSSYDLGDNWYKTHANLL